MSRLRYGEVECVRGAEESVLDALLRAGAAVPHMCKAGSCGSCLLRASAGEAPAAAQTGLKDSWKARGYFLACVCRPEGDLEIEPPGAEARRGGRIEHVKKLSGTVLRVKVRCDAAMDYKAGQYVTVVRKDGLARSYSIANPGEGEEIELHVRKLPNGKMSGWLAGEEAPGARVTLVGPSGECFYVAGRPEQGLLLAGTGTGLAPLYGILRDALQQGHGGPIWLVHGAVEESGLYLREELTELARAHGNVTYQTTLLATDGPIDGVIVKARPKLAGWRGYVCGDQAVVQTLQKKLFLAGMSLRDIYGDAFLASS